ncbi:mediator complex subunit 27-domain-containing protein [Gigaspora margarita]|uniref:Mediator complex subunit 27-domain-containing protein n=1 Tax=Gigaspora margarita TaxID=4874 RepID=A0A8H4A344_GIGMA|nr:mediator complex subunit 27-domain-containing protein [Gigaspora margarita]
MNQAKDGSELDLKAGIKKLDNLLEMVEELRASFMSVCDYLGELLNSGQFQDNAETLEREKRGEKSLTPSFDVDRFGRMNDSCLNTMDKFLQLIGSCGDELEYARKISATWKDNSSIPVKKFLAMNINGKSGETINYKEDTQKNCQQAANIYTKESDVYFKRRKKDGIFGTIEIYDASKLNSAIDDWLAEAKQRPYPVAIEKVECDLSGRPSGLMVLVNNLLKAGIILKYNDINGSSVSFVRLTIIGYQEKKSIREFSDILVFQRITQIGLELFNNLDQSDPMPKLLDWISSFHDLYTSKCHHCKKLLSFDSHVYKYLPPVRRVFIDGKFLPFHYNCNSKQV